jgi:sulfur-oxidizing protein SoxX
MKNLLLASVIVVVAPAFAQAQQPTPLPGLAIAFDRAKGNRLACHMMRGSDVPSNVGPELSDVKKRFPDRAELVAILNDETKRNPQTPMPAFGRNAILTADEIEKIVDFLYTL